MVVYGEERLDAVFSALADPTRRTILLRLRDGGEASASAIAAPFPMSLPGVTKHLRSLQRAHLIDHRKKGRERLYRLQPEPLQIANRWLTDYESFWNARLDSLNEFVRTEQPNES